MGSTQTIREPTMSRANEHHWYSEAVPWTEKQLENYYRNHGFGLMQQGDIVDGGVPPRVASNKSAAKKDDGNPPGHREADEDDF